MHVLSLLQNKFGLVFFRLFDGALETSNFRFEEARSAITLLRCFLHENTQHRKIARVNFAEQLGTMSKNRLRWITLVRGPIWGIHSLTLMISCNSKISENPEFSVYCIAPRNARSNSRPSTAILVSYSLLLELKTGFCSTIGVQPEKMDVRSLLRGKDWH